MIESLLLSKTSPSDKIISIDPERDAPYIDGQTMPMEWVSGRRFNKTSTGYPKIVDDPEMGVCYQLNADCSGELPLGNTKLLGLIPLKKSWEIRFLIKSTTITLGLIFSTGDYGLGPGISFFESRHTNDYEVFNTRDSGYGFVRHTVGGGLIPNTWHNYIYGYDSIKNEVYMELTGGSRRTFAVNGLADTALRISHPSARFNGLIKLIEARLV